MKLYATTTSERARKGQGGNDYLNIVIRNEKQQPIAHMTFYPDVPHRITLLDSEEWDVDSVAWIGTDDDTKDQSIGMYKPQKGEKQKGEMIAGVDYPQWIDKLQSQ